MSETTLSQVAELAGRVGHALVVSADAAGLPHVAVADEVAFLSGSQVGVSAWYCPGTLDNLQANPRLSLVAWDGTTDEGHQLLGEVRQVEDVAVMDGYEPNATRADPVPQMRRRFVVEVTKVLRFTRAPHSDAEEFVSS